MTEKYYYEVYAVAAEKHSKRQWITIILLIILLTASNAYWVWNSRQFETIETTTIEATQDGEGYNVVSGGDAYVTEGQDN